jgi:alpha-beta hydrolase superfamily lysophospholipase
MRRLLIFSLLTASWLSACTIGKPETNGRLEHPDTAQSSPSLASLNDLSMDALRARGYGSKIVFEKKLAEGSRALGTALLASYLSDGLRVYTRIDIPVREPPPAGFPVVLFVHGWYGKEQAPSFDFFLDADSAYAHYINRYVEAGFVVLSPGLRGHGTVNGQPADGIAFLDAWDNGSYLAPLFYAVDILNLLEGIGSLEFMDRSAAGLSRLLSIDLGRISIAGHSQGGDAVLAALAASGEGSAVRNRFFSGSIISGCFGPRLEQAAIYGPMSNTLQAFMSGDGSWTGTAIGRDGSLNPDFVFGYPPDWIATVDPGSPEWTWQAETWNVPSVARSLELKFDEMYRAVNDHVQNLSNATFRVLPDDRGRTTIIHDPRIEAAMEKIGGFTYERYLTEPLHLHHSDQDYYSIPRWNRDLSKRINSAGGRSADFNYPQNNHGLRASEFEWFSQGEVLAGFDYMMMRDIDLFTSAITAPPELPAAFKASPAGHKMYASALRNEFQTAFERPPLEGHARRVVSFTSDGLRQYALVVEPVGARPENGWPVLVMNHGYHPDPPMNGRDENGVSDRPGDYYRGLPLAYARGGFLVIWPDFRGHNASEGFEYTQTADPPAWYARDVIAAVRAIGSLEEADASKVFMWGHSMGGTVTLQALAALGNEVRAASVWSAWLTDSKKITGRHLSPVPETLPIPLNIQHAEGDPVVPSSGSKWTGQYRESRGLEGRLYIYPGENHLFTERNLERAINRDLAFFEKYSH